MRKCLILLCSFFASCEVIEIDRKPLLSPPLGLIVYTKTSGGNQAAFYFQGNNREVYFSGYRVYITTDLADLQRLDADSDNLFALPPASAVLSQNFQTPSDTEVSMTFNGAMASSQEIIYPNSASTDSTSGEIVLISSPLTTFNNTTPFASGVTYYVGIYAYSRADNKLSAPSIAQFQF